MPSLFETRKKGRRDPPDAFYIAEAEPPAKGRRIVSDSHRDAPRGFALRINANGGMVFVLRYNAAGKDRLLSVGEVGTWSLAAARKQAAVYRQRIDSGEDILEARRTEQREPIVSDVVTQFLKAKADLKSKENIESIFRLYLLPEFGTRQIKNVRRREVIATVERVAETAPRQAALLLTYTKQLFAHAEDRELIEGNPVATLRASKVSKALAPNARGRILDDEELRAFWTKAETCGVHRLTALALKMILVTGQRPGEVAGMRWREVSGRIWTIPAERRGKTNTSHSVPLTETAETILEAAQTEATRLSRRRKTNGEGHVFPTRPGRPITSSALGRAVIRYAQRLGSKDDGTWGQWRPHDLRRTMRTGLSAAGVNEVVAETTIGHTRKGIAAVYDLHRYDAEKRAALEAWERRLLRIAEGMPADDNVVALNRPPAR